MLDIITITKDDIEGVKKTIESTNEIRQFENVNQILIDSSKKEIAADIYKIVQHGKNLQYFYQTPTGRASAFNEGIKKSSKNWLWFLNGGDKLHHNLDITMLIKIIENSSADVLYFAIDKIPGNRRFTHPSMYLMWSPYIPWMCHPGAIYNKSVFDKYGTYNVKYKSAMDYEYWIRLTTKNIQIDFSSIPVAIFNTEGISQNKKSITPLKESLLIFRKHFFRLIYIGIYRKFVVFRYYYFWIKRLIRENLK